MKKTFKALKPVAIFAVIVLALIGCDKEFNAIDSDVLGKENSNFTTNRIDIDVLTYNKKLDSLQINGLNSNLLGVYIDPLYGKTTASIVAQVIPTSFNPDFGTNPAIDSVILSIPYFSRPEGVDEDGNTMYVMNENDSLYGSGKIKLSIYQNKYFLRDFNPNAQEQEVQNYFSFSENTGNTNENFMITDNGSVNFDTQKGQLLFMDEDYLPNTNPEEIIVGEESTFSPPALRVPLDMDFWTATILEKEGGSELTNANNFKNYFRGLYIKAEKNVDSDGNLQLLNLASTSANITIYYSKNSETDNTIRVQSTYVLNFSGTRLNTFINEFSTVLANGDKALGDEKLYLKGTSGSMAILDLFGPDIDGNDIPDALENLRGNFLDADGEPIRLINEARLIIFEDESVTGDEHAFDRIYAYNINNNTPLIDYNFDPSDNQTDPLNSKFIHLGQRDTIGSGNDMGYKIRITEYMKNLIFQDSLNTKIGLVISNNVNYITSAEILNTNDDVTEVPTATLITPRGTILYGNNTTSDKKIKLEIFYSKPTN